MPTFPVHAYHIAGHCYYVWWPAPWISPDFGPWRSQDRRRRTSTWDGGRKTSPRTVSGLGFFQMWEPHSPSRPSKTRREAPELNVHDLRMLWRVFPSLPPRILDTNCVVGMFAQQSKRAGAPEEKHRKDCWAFANPYREPWSFVRQRAVMACLFMLAHRPTTRGQASERTSERLAWEASPIAREDCLGSFAMRQGPPAVRSKGLIVVITFVAEACGCHSALVPVLLAVRI